MTREYSFTLTLRGEWDDLSLEMSNKLFEAGCDDGTACFRAGRVFVVFDREAASMREAVAGAVADVRKAGYDVERVAESDLVTQADIARRSSRRRQHVYQWMTGKRGPGGFPPPAGKTVDGGDLWSWRDVARWLQEHDMVDDGVWEAAREIEIANTVLLYQSRRAADPDLFDTIAEELEGAAK